MANMSHCRFENTVSDLDDCYENLEDDLEGYEARARTKLIAICADIVILAADHDWLDRDTRRNLFAAIDYGDLED